MTMRKAAQTLGLCGFLAETVGFYPRAKKHATGMFFPACGPSSCFHLHLSTAKQRTPTSGWCSLFWRKRWDSNPRAREGYLISSQARYDHFDTLPYNKYSVLAANHIISSAELSSPRTALHLCQLRKTATSKFVAALPPASYRSSIYFTFSSEKSQVYKNFMTKIITKF
mgnify:FL=1